MAYGRQIGDNIYSPEQYSFLKKHYSTGDSPDTVYKSDVDNMESKANFYGDQAEVHGANASALEAGSGGNPTASGVGSAIAKGGSPADMASNGLLASGNPYAMAAGGILKVASMGQQREQAKLEAQRAAFIDRQNKMREATDKLIAMDYGI